MKVFIVLNDEIDDSAICKVFDMLEKAEEYVKKEDYKPYMCLSIEEWKVE